MSRREDKRDQGGGKEHLDNRDAAIITAENLGERVCVIDTEALGSTLSKF